MSGDISLQLTKVKEEVENVLADDSHARNSDLWLLLKIWKKQGIKVLLPVGMRLEETTMPESVRRCRQQLNNAGEYLPTDASVLKRRRLLQNDWRDHFGSQGEGQLVHVQKQQEVVA